MQLFQTLFEAGKRETAISTVTWHQAGGLT
jgi:hypothetical protein